MYDRDLYRAARTAAKLTRKQFAGRAGVGERTIAHLEDGTRRTPRPGTLARIDAALAEAGIEVTEQGIRRRAGPKSPPPPGEDDGDPGAA
jgi:transcriptional regulator with XRE-family HTH domain